MRLIHEQKPDTLAACNAGQPCQHLKEASTIFERESGICFRTSHPGADCCIVKLIASRRLRSPLMSCARIVRRMMSDIEIQAFLTKAEENLASATSEFVNGRYNACANRCYYACFQAAIAALMQAGIRPPRGAQGAWGHAFVQAQFAGELVNRRKLYAASG